jgi:inosine/xanthosine triphosphatase
MKTIVISSQNPVKIQAAVRGFERMFPQEVFTVESISVPSGVSRQPWGGQETRQGAFNRVRAAAAALPAADFWVGVEGGVEEDEGQLGAFAWIVVLSERQTGMGRTGTFFLPPAVAALVRQGKELGEADDLIFQRENSKQANGAIGLLSGNAVDRTELYEQAVILALVPFKNPDLYPSQDHSRA